LNRLLKPLRNGLERLDRLTGRMVKLGGRVLGASVGRLDRLTDRFVAWADPWLQRGVKALDRRYERVARRAGKGGRAGAKWARAHPRRSGAIALVALGLMGGLLAYAALKRPADVTNENAVFKEKEDVPGKSGKGVTRTTWPLYGHDQARTKFLPGKNLDPPFKLQWRFEAHKLLEFPPIFANDTIYGMNNDAAFYALNPRNGEPRWRRDMGSLTASSPAYADGKVYGVTLQPPQAFALDADSGKVIWRKAMPGRIESSPVVSNKRVYFGCECGTLYALRTRNGDTAWTTRLAGAIKAAPALSRGVLYVGDYGGQMSAVRASNGSIVWRTGSQGAGFGRTGEFYSTAAVAYGRVYVGNNDGRIYSFEQGSGNLAWSRSLGGYVYSGPAVADTDGTDPTVYVGSFDNRMHALDARTGDERWSADGGGNVSGAITVVGNTAYVSNVDSTLTRGFDVRSHKQVYSTDTGAYTSMISDGHWLYLVGYSSVRALKPVKRHSKKHKG
jgi:outer membrane protein assembly factor BamB